MANIKDFSYKGSQRINRYSSEGFKHKKVRKVYLGQNFELRKKKLMF